MCSEFQTLIKLGLYVCCFFARVFFWHFILRRERERERKIGIWNRFVFQFFRMTSTKNQHYWQSVAAGERYLSNCNHIWFKWIGNFSKTTNRKVDSRWEHVIVYLFINLLSFCSLTLWLCSLSYLYCEFDCVSLQTILVLNCVSRWRNGRVQVIDFDIVVCTLSHSLFISVGLCVIFIWTDFYYFTLISLFASRRSFLTLFFFFSLSNNKSTSYQFVQLIESCHRSGTYSLVSWVISKLSHLSSLQN